MDETTNRKTIAMAYFSNGSAGSVFDEQCSICRYGQDACPIALIQITYNYDVVNNKVASEILDTLVSNDGTCAMYKEFKDDFKMLKSDPNQTHLDL